MLSRHAPCTWGWQGSCSNYYKHYLHLLCPPGGIRHRPPSAFCCDSPKHGPRPARSHRSRGPRPRYALCMYPGRPCHIQWAHLGHGGVLPGPGVTFYHHPGCTPGARHSGGFAAQKPPSIGTPMAAAPAPRGTAGHLRMPKCNYIWPPGPRGIQHRPLECRETPKTSETNKTPPLGSRVSVHMRMCPRIMC